VLSSEPLKSRCLFAGGSASGVLGVEGEALARCMNFIVASRDDIVFGCLVGCAIVLNRKVVDCTGDNQLVQDSAVPDFAPLCGSLRSSAGGLLPGLRGRASLAALTYRAYLKRTRSAPEAPVSRSACQFGAIIVKFELMLILHATTRYIRLPATNSLSLSLMILMPSILHILLQQLRHRLRPRLRPPSQ
jgi:hypothetical protein